MLTDNQRIELLERRCWVNEEIITLLGVIIIEEIPNMSYKFSKLAKVWDSYIEQNQKLKENMEIMNEL